MVVQNANVCVLGNGGAEATVKRFVEESSRCVDLCDGTVWNVPVNAHLTAGGKLVGTQGALAEESSFLAAHLSYLFSRFSCRCIARSVVGTARVPVGNAAAFAFINSSAVARVRNVSACRGECVASSIPDAPVSDSTYNFAET